MSRRILLLVALTLLGILAALCVYVTHRPLLQEIVATSEGGGITLKGKSPLKGNYICFWFCGMLEGPQIRPRGDALHMGCQRGTWEFSLDDPLPAFPLTLQVNRCPDTLRWWERILPVQRSQVVTIPAPDRNVVLENILPEAGIWTVTTDQALAREFGKVPDQPEKEN